MTDECQLCWQFLRPGVEHLCASGGDHTAACGRHFQVCPYCATPLLCESDYVGGGSHYWLLRCTKDGSFNYDTYGFRLYDKTFHVFSNQPPLGDYDADRYRTYAGVIHAG